MEYDNKNRISLWLNEKRQKQEHPHLNGQGETDGEVWASAWFARDIDPNDAKELMQIVKRHRQNNKSPFISISLKAKEQKQSNSSFEDNDDIPF